MTATETFSRAFITLPREFYLEGPRVRARAARNWDRQWIYLDRTSDIPEPGDFLARDVIGESVIVTRTPSGEIAAMLNVCHTAARACSTRPAVARSASSAPTINRPMISTAAIAMESSL
jgi:p-cumate 2,3-dioxygenase alpha subunit